VYRYNEGDPAEPAVAVYPSEGTLAMDYRITVVGRSGDGTDGRNRDDSGASLEKTLDTPEPAGDPDDGVRRVDSRIPFNVT
jgi:hypothetical protein